MSPSFEVSESEQFFAISVTSADISACSNSVAFPNLAILYLSKAIVFFFKFEKSLVLSLNLYIHRTNAFLHLISICFHVAI